MTEIIPAYVAEQLHAAILQTYALQMQICHQISPAWTSSRHVHGSDQVCTMLSIRENDVGISSSQSMDMHRARVFIRINLNTKPKSKTMLSTR